MPMTSTVRRTFFVVALLASTLSPQLAAADHDAAARAAQASDPQYSAGYLGSWNALHKMKPMDVMHMMDADKKGYVTREEFMKFQEQLFERMDRDHDDKITAPEWMGSREGAASAKR